MEKTNSINIMKRFFSFIAIIAMMAVMTVQAQDRKPDWARWHYLSEEEMNTPVRATSFTETPPPTGEPRFVGEFEPMQGAFVLSRWKNLVRA